VATFRWHAAGVTIATSDVLPLGCCRDAHRLQRVGTGGSNTCPKRLVDIRVVWSAWIELARYAA